MRGAPVCNFKNCMACVVNHVCFKSIYPSLFQWKVVRLLNLWLLHWELFSFTFLFFFSTPSESIATYFTHTLVQLVYPFVQGVFCFLFISVHWCTKQDPLSGLRGAKRENHDFIIKALKAASLHRAVRRRRCTEHGNGNISEHTNSLWLYSTSISVSTN